MNTPDTAAGASPEPAAEQPPPACVMTFNASDPSGAGGLAGDVSTITAMGAHPLPVATSIVVRDTAEVFDQHVLEPEVIAEQARSILEDVTITAWKVGFLGSAEGIGAVAEILADYPDVPLVSYLPNLSWLEEDAQVSYLDAFRELVLPQTEVLVGNQQTLTDFLLPEWESERPPSARELAVAAAEHGASYVLVTGVQVANLKGAEASIDNVLASPQGAVTGEKFERFDTAFVGAGDTLSAALAALLSTDSELPAAVSEALTFLDQALDAGFRPGMGNVVPDRFFWALPPPEEGEAEEAAAEPPAENNKPPRQMH